MLARLVLVWSVMLLMSVDALAQGGVERGADYATARQSLLSQGYQPLAFPRDGIANHCFRATVCGAFPEVIECSGAGAGFCRFAFRSPGGGYLVGVTAGERIRDLRLERVWSASEADRRLIEDALAGRAW